MTHPGCRLGRPRGIHRATLLLPEEIDALAESGGLPKTARSSSPPKNSKGMPMAEKPSYHQRIVSALRGGEWRTLREIHRAVARFIDADLADREFRKRHPAWEQVDRNKRVAQGKKRLVLLGIFTNVLLVAAVCLGAYASWRVSASFEESTRQQDTNVHSPTALSKSACRNRKTRKSTGTSRVTR